MREDVDRVRALRAATLDAARPEAVAKRRKTGHWTAREQVDALLDPGSFAEYGALTRPIRDDMEGAADGLITGTGQVAGQSCAILAYDYTVYAGTQSLINHKKHDRIFEVTEKLPPPLVEAALGEIFTPDDIGPVEVQEPNGVIDILAADEGEAIELAKKYLSYFRGPSDQWRAPEVAALRDIIPENPRRAYNVRKVIEDIADIGSVLELRAKFGRAIVTSLVRIEGRAVGVIANQPMFLAGAIDSPASDKAARFIQLCDAHDIPMLFLSDTPGLMVGPEIEKTALVRHSGRLLINLAAASVPFMTIVLRKAYGLGGYVMGARGLDPALCVGWPTAEFGGMGLEGAVNITHAKELAAAPDEAARADIHARATADLKRMNTGIEIAAKFEIDDIIDPADTRHFLGRTLDAMPTPPPRSHRKHAIDAW